MAVIKAVSSKAGIGQALDYVTKEEKTEDKLVSGLHCEPDTVKDEMQATKELWGKTGGRTYKHFVHSYHEDEHITPEQAHKNAIELVNAFQLLLKGGQWASQLERNTSPRGKSNSLFPCHTASVGFGAKPQEGSRGVSPAHDFTE